MKTRYRIRKDEPRWNNPWALYGVRAGAVIWIERHRTFASAVRAMDHDAAEVVAGAR